MQNKGFFAGQILLEGDVKIQNLEVYQEIDRSNSDVFLAKLNNQDIAIKRMEINNNYEYQSYLQEISMLQSLSLGSQGIHIVEYYGYFVMDVESKWNSGSFSTNKNKQQTQIFNKKYGYLCMERAICNLTQFSKQKQICRSRITRQQIICALECMLYGFSILQAKDIAHCDIKPENILVVDESKLKIKICDVGSSKIIDLADQKQATIKGTLSFLAPQLIRIEATKITSINPFRSDVFSFGLVLLFLITGKKFTTHERKEVKQDVYFQIIQEWTKIATEIMIEEFQVIDVLKKSLERDSFKRPVFNELKNLYESLSKKRKIIKQNGLKKLERRQSEHSSIDKFQSISIKSQFPKVSSPSPRLANFSSRPRLNIKSSISSNFKSQLDKNSKGKKKVSNDKLSKTKRSADKNSSKAFPFQKSTMYSTFSIDKSRLSFRNQTKRIVHITKKNSNLIPYETFGQQLKIFVLFCPNIMFELAHSIIIKKNCSVEVFDKLCNISSAVNLYVQFNEADIFGTDENTSTITNFESVYISLEHSNIEGGYNNFLRCLCPITLKNLHLVLSGSTISFGQVRAELERLKNKELNRLEIYWDGANINTDQFNEMNEKLSKLMVKRMTYSLGSTFLSTQQKSRWPLPSKAKSIYLNFPNNFLSKILGNLGVSLSQLNQLKQLYLNLENNSLLDTDIKLIIRHLSKVKALQKMVLNFSCNPIQKALYCFEQLIDLHKISSLQLRIAKSQIPIGQFLKIFEYLVQLFDKNLKILKISYDRMTQTCFLRKTLDKIINSMSLKLDIIGYDNNYLMIYVKKKSFGQKNIKFKMKDSKAPSSINSIESPGSYSLTTTRTIPLYTSPVNRIKDEEDDCVTLQNIKGNNQNKNGGTNAQRICEALFSTYPTYQCYICLGCIESRETAKAEYFCRACIQNCEHKGHHIVRTYEKKTCNCPFNQKCHFKSEDCNQFVCAEKLDIRYKRQYKCNYCYPERSLCQGCVFQCKQSHSGWVETGSSCNFICGNSNFFEGGKV